MYYSGTGEFHQQRPGNFHVPLYLQRPTCRFIGEVPPVLAQSRQQRSLRRLHRYMPQRGGQFSLPSPGNDPHAFTGETRCKDEVL